MQHRATRLRGGYSTPAPIARLLAEWAVQEPAAEVLEPGAGDGALVAEIVARLGEGGRLTAVELNGGEAARLRERGGARTRVVEGDLFAWFAADRPEGRFDAVVGNPPFVRYHHFPEEQRQAAFALMREVGLHPTRLTNAWLPFVVVATRALREGGRLALVLPAELLQVGYAAELREYLARAYRSLTIVTFRRLLFAGLQQETLLLLGVRGEQGSARITLVDLAGQADLTPCCVASAAGLEVELDHAREKWTRYYLTAAELALVRELERCPAFARLGNLASVDVGVVTGRNQFFVLTAQAAEEQALRPWCLPLVGRSAQIPGLVLTRQGWEQLAEAGDRCLLLQLGDAERAALPAPARAYVERGEAAGIHQGFKCRIRLPRWWHLPTAWAPDAFLLRQIHEAPRIVRNRAGATCTDTIHRVRVRPGIEGDWLAVAALNSLTLAFAEIRGRSYGGGVLELEPSEAEALPLPPPAPLPLSLDEADGYFRRYGLVATLDLVDRLTLGAAGLSRREIAALRGVWQKLAGRRRARRARG